MLRVVLTPRILRCNFYLTKAANVRACTDAVVRSGFPKTLEGLLKLQGVGPKIANLLRSITFSDEGAGLVVDTHVHRVAKRLGWIDLATWRGGPERTRRSLEAWVPADGYDHKLFAGAHFAIEHFGSTVP